jgi:hypothetical protein
MQSTLPPSWATLAWPWVRRELLINLEDLSVPDPRERWQKERAEGLASGIGEVIHFFFDDHDFEQELGLSLFDGSELEAIIELKNALDAISKELPKPDDDAYVNHRLWVEVTRHSDSALKSLNR